MRLIGTAMPKFVIAGTGRSGTGYVAEYLGQLGLRAGHEKVFTPRTAHGIDSVDWGEWEADCSWLALPSLPIDATVILVYREPLKTVQSLIDLGFFDTPESGYALAIRKFVPQVFKETTKQDQALMFWYLWNISLEVYADWVLPLDSPRFEEKLCEAVGNRYLIPKVEKTFNSKDEHKQVKSRLVWDDFRPRLAELAHNLNERLT